jgi:DNA replication protein DnaC
MIAEQTLDKMKKMRLKHMAATLGDMSDDPATDGMTFADGLAMLIDHEWDFRHNHKTALLCGKAGFLDVQACVEAIDYSPERGIDRQKVVRLATCDYIKARQDILVLGKTGVGKSFVAQALGNAACRHHRATRYVRMPGLFEDLAIAGIAGSLGRAMDSWVKPSLVIIDDCFLTQPTATDINRFMELVEKRMHVGSTIYCSQLDPGEWHERIEEKIVADAILDRIVNRAHIIEVKGDSMRKRKAVK